MGEVQKNQAAESLVGFYPICIRGKVSAVYPKGYQTDFPDTFSLNCWNYDPKWEISWYENGIKVGAPKKNVALDPWSVELHKGPTLPQRRTWVEPQLTDHLFFFQPNSTENLVVEVKDRFGNKYTKMV